MTAPAPSWRQRTARVLSQERFGAGHHWLDIDLPRDFAVPRPGQFVQLLLPSAPSVLLPRPMSVAGARRRGRGWALGFLYEPVGTGTRALAGLGPGARIEALGPLGRGFPLERPGTPVLVAGGRGVAPLLFAAETLRLARRRFEFLFGARTRERLVGLRQARAGVARARGRLHVCTDDGSAGHPGHVVSLLERLSPRFAQPIVIHACGPHAMLEAVARWAMGRGVPAFLAMESVMPCGTGVCRGCPLPRSARSRAAFGNQAPSLQGNRDFAMCCTEGPVFEAAALDWERIE